MTDRTPTPAERALRFGDTAIKTPANAVTIIRLLFAIPVLIWILDQHHHGHTNWGTFTGWLLLWVTDLLDGWLARREGATRSGAFLDPLADKLLVSGALLALAARGDLPWLPVLIIVGREAGMTAWRYAVSRQGVSVPARTAPPEPVARRAVARRRPLDRVRRRPRRGHPPGGRPRSHDARPPDLAERPT